ncbi:unnamed protein product [Rotaria magnacalcarata]|uniref:Transient receptor ion channel domain-containing protein n=6 Tax=Rotaria magnacalcarata TaxID=392030 RepID=A0A816JXF0_9BILA|nr:unnamed protein product [Rotaria magnacalcarata]CAF1636541.1 unnamed protein product [Rotaria magnacalcarata]CAF1911879.1 unnamed protein product [Rotaria magnacalcarata]
MASTGSNTPSSMYEKRFSDPTKVNIRGRSELIGARNSLYKQAYNHMRNTEMNIDEKFVRACENGDYSTVHQILLENPKFSIDVTNQLGRTAMQLAIENEHLEVVTHLLSQCDGQKMREAILLAIYLGHVQIAETCLRHPKFKILFERRAITADEESFWHTPSSDDGQFSPDITPLILAAQYNRTEIVQILLMSGDRITKPHDYHCKCLQCHHKFKFDSLRHAQSRLNAYRGLASESYISLVSVDPILTAFELGRELRDLSAKEKYFKNEYMNLADQLSAYAVKLLDKVRGHRELDCVLGKTGKESEEKYLLLARLYLAIKYSEKPFVAHSNCQQKLVEIWHSQIRNLFKLNPLLILLLIILYIFVLPFACILYILTSWPNYTNKIQRFLQQPCIKFIGHIISYAIFIVLIIVSSLLFAGELKKPLTKLSVRYPGLSLALNQSLTNAHNSSNGFDCDIYPDDDLYFRANRPTWIDITISVFVIGFLWHEIKQAYNDGLQDYFLSWNNIVDSCMNILYLSSFALKYYVIYQVIDSTRRLGDPNFQKKLEDICGLPKAEQLNIYYTFYWLNADRFYWVSFDPINVAEGLFAIANIFSFSRICFLLPAFQHLGPLQISLGRMMSDIGKFIIIFLIIFCGFMFGLNNLFWYYKSTVRSSVEVELHNSGDELSAEESFGTMATTFKTVFWSLFGLAEKEGVELKGFNKHFTETVGYLIYGAFSIANVIVLLNMLIAMMSKSYETIEEHADVEWKFARSKLYMEYIKEGGTLPVPFNIIPTPKSFYYLFRRIFSCVKKLKRPSTDRSNSMETNNLAPSMSYPSGPGLRTPNSNGNGIPTVSNRQISNINLAGNNNYRVRQGSFDVNQTLTYRKVMNRVLKRFILNKQREEQEEIREGDFEELKQDIQMLRIEMLHRLDKTRDDLSKSSVLLNEGVVVVGDLLSTSVNDTNPSNTVGFYAFKKSFYSRTDSGLESNASTLSQESRQTLTQSTHTSTVMPHSKTTPNFTFNSQQESDINPIDLVKHLSVVNLKLSDISEEDENLHKNLKFIDDDDDDDDVETPHMSEETSTNNDAIVREKY